MSARKKVIRHLTKQGKIAKAPNKVDAINELIVADAIKAGVKTCQLLHPTGGYYKFSLSRIACLGGHDAMWAIISETIRKACTEETVKKDAIPGII